MTLASFIVAPRRQPIVARPNVALGLVGLSRERGGCMAARCTGNSFDESIACRRIVKLRRGLLLWPLVRPTRATARRASVTSSAESNDR
jgi:hypothetical protein